MSAQSLFYIIIAIVIIDYLSDRIISHLNAQKFDDPIPEDLKDLYQEQEYKRSQAYKMENYRLSNMAAKYLLFITIAFLMLDGFDMVDRWAREITSNATYITLIFFGIISWGSDILTTPISFYQTFVIEQKYGFNKSSIKTFILDKIKGWILMAILGGGILALFVWFYQIAGDTFWLYAWGIVGVFTLFIHMFYSQLIVPLFNKQSPLEEGSLKTKLQAYASKVGFHLENIFVIDGSKRSTKANAYFSGFGKQKRITLYDTLIEDLEEEEIVAVLAHEVGHYKRKHIIFNIIASIALTGVSLYILSLCISIPELSLAIGVSKSSFHAGLMAFGLLYSPMTVLTSIVMNYFSRKFEYQADNYAKQTYAAQPLITSLKKLSRTNLSNLTPHPAYVFVNYSHPTLLQRIKNLKFGTPK
ncbi:M48 family metallopeptidase [Galbibacter sp.]|uniref:M48 family metallopeptidase n=1 Tax=Galbibacter sp. TaxID=2918471 RepID=UPI002C3DF2FC|nr:M48 family metallopeptidase [Galbibacter sp.]HLV63065.1 M48 family metallopeptidase [Galbibacter sp.]